MPGSIYELADANLQHGMQGTRSYRNFPVWGRVIKDELVQVVTPYELNLYKSLHSITIPQELDLKERRAIRFLCSIRLFDFDMYRSVVLLVII